jgi:hypothetical protein
MILPSPIRLNNKNFGIKEMLDMFLEGIKILLNIRLAFEQIDPCKTAEIVQKTHIILKITTRSDGRAPHIRLNKFKGTSGYMSGTIIG